MDLDTFGGVQAASPDALVVLTDDGRDRPLERRAHRSIFGYEHREALGLMLVDLVTPAEQAASCGCDSRDYRRPARRTYEAVRRRKDGSLLYVDVSTRLVRGADGSAARPVPPRRTSRTSRSLRDAKLMEARFRDLLESTPDGIVMANPTGHIVIANSQAERLFGYDQRRAARHARSTPCCRSAIAARHVAHRSNYFHAAAQAGDGLGARPRRAAQGRHRVPGRDQPEPAARRRRAHS